MAKKIVFLLVMVFVLLIASVTVFAAETDLETSQVGFTKDETILAVEETDKEVSVSDLENKYREIFFDENISSSKEILTISSNNREYGYELRHLFSCVPSDDSSFDMENPYIMLMYIKVDGVYVPLNDIKTETNMTQEVFCLKTTVDLEYLGSNKVNEIRIIAFRKNDIESLEVDKNLQITDLNMSVRKWNPIEKLFIDIFK